MIKPQENLSQFCSQTEQLKYQSPKNICSKTVLLNSPKLYRNKEPTGFVILLLSQIVNFNANECKNVKLNNYSNVDESKQQIKVQ